MTAVCPKMGQSKLHDDYPWLNQKHCPIIAAPMMNITMANFSICVSSSGGIGFLAAGFDLSNLSKNLTEAADLCRTNNIPLHHEKLLPIGVGFQNWGADLDTAIEAMSRTPVAAAWFFGAKQLSDLVPWSKAIRQASNGLTKIWIQVGTVAEALEVARTSKPDVIVVQGSDSGGHGLSHRASLMTLLPEVDDALKKEGFDIPLVAAGGIVDARGAAAAQALGASGVCLGTRFLASKEAVIASGYQNEVVRVSDGGVSTVSTKVYDKARGIDGWPVTYAGRGVANRTYLDHTAGMSGEENRAMYEEAKKLADNGWGPQGRMTTYAGTGVGLVRAIKSVKEIIQEVGEPSRWMLERNRGRYSRL
jgi:nitronate monooxygenase